MHDIDRVRLETQAEKELYEAGPFESEQFEFNEMPGSVYGESGGVFTETQEMELASELLEIANEQELDRFLGKLIGRAARAVGTAVRSPVGQAIGGILKGAARQVLPTIGSAIGSYFGGDRGAQLGGQAASAAGRMFGLELEGMSHEDQEFEIARRYVSFAGEAVKNLALAPPQQDIRTAAKNAVVAAAQTHAPGLLKAGGTAQRPSTAAVNADLPKGHSGRWVRRGNKITLYGI